MLLAHGLCSPAIFALANVRYESVGSRSLLMTKGLISFFPFFTFLWFLVCSRNMAAPPSLNLAREICLFVGLMGEGLYLGVFLALISFFGGAYRLYLYTARQHGRGLSLGLRLLPIKMRRFLIVLLHWVPLNLLFCSFSLFCN